MEKLCHVKLSNVLNGSDPDFDENAYMVPVTQIERIQVFLKFDLLFPDLWHFQILRKRQFSS